MKHNGDWHERKRCSIEAEFGERLPDLIRGLHWDMRVPLCHVAGVLAVSEKTLRRWCRDLGIPTRTRGYEKMPTAGKVQQRAQELGYESIPAAIGAMRAAGMRWVEVRAALDCSDATMCRYYPESARGYYHLSTEGREVKAASARRLNESGQGGRMPSLRYVTPAGADYG